MAKKQLTMAEKLEASDDLSPLSNFYCLFREWFDQHHTLNSGKVGETVKQLRKEGLNRMQIIDALLEELQ